MKRYLFIISKAPYESAHAFEQLEAAMVAAAFDGAVSVLLRGNGVWGLQANQSGDAVGQKTFSKVLGALPTYEIEHLYVCTDSVRQRSLRVDESLGLESADYARQSQLINASDIVIGGQ